MPFVADMSRDIKEIKGILALNGIRAFVSVPKSDVQLANEVAQTTALGLPPAHNLVARHSTDRGFAKGQPHMSS